MISFNNLKKQNKKAKKEVKFTDERKSKYDDQAVVVVTSVKNTLHLPKGKTQNLIGFNKGEAVNIAANYIDANWTVDVFKENYPELYEEVKNSDIVVTGADIIASLTNKEVHASWDKALVDEVISQIEEELEYVVPAIVVGRKELDYTITTLEQYETLPPELKEQYTCKKTTNKDGVETARISPKGIISYQNSFSASQVYAELNGTSEVYYEKDCINIVSEEDLKKSDVELWNRSVVYKLASTPIKSEEDEVGASKNYYIAYGQEIVSQRSRKNKTNKEDTDVNSGGELPENEE